MPRGATKPYPQKARERIAADRLLKKLQDHVDGQLEMTQTQLKAAEILLRKCLPDMKAIEITGEDGGPIVTRIIPDEELLKGVSDT
jgi:hypothetical protein